MTRDQAKLIVDHFDIVRHFAEGGMLDYDTTDWEGKPRYHHAREGQLLIDCLSHYRIVKSPPATYPCLNCPLRNE